jgi:hypothetical protein
MTLTPAHTYARPSGALSASPGRRARVAISYWGWCWSEKVTYGF